MEEDLPMPIMDILASVLFALTTKLLLQSGTLNREMRMLMANYSQLDFFHDAVNFNDS